MQRLRREDRWALAGALLVVAVVVADRLVPAALAPVLVIAPVVTAAGADRGRTAVVTALAAAGAVVCVALDDLLSSAQHVVQLTVVMLGSLAAVHLAGIRSGLHRERAARVRSEYLARVGRLLEAPPDPDAMLDEIASLAIPDMGDLSTIDLLRGPVLRCVATGAADPAVATAVREQRAARPVPLDSLHPVADAAATGQPRLLRELTDADREALALARDDARSAIVAPLVARGETLGVLTLARLGAHARPYDEGDLGTVAEIARRAALALDSASLIRNLSVTEARLEAILVTLAEAVTVQRPSGELEFANDAAAQLLGFATPAELVATPVRDVADRFIALDEHGSPVDASRYPGRHALAGEDDPEPLLTRTIDRRSGEERWVLTKARPLRDADGRVAYAVNVMEDVTEVRRAEREQRLLAAASKLVSSSLDVELTFEKAAWAAVPELADWCCVDVPDERGRLERRALAAEPDRIEALTAARDAAGADPFGVVEQVLREGRACLLDDADHELLRQVGVRSLLIAPLMAGDRVLGLMTLGTDTSGRRLHAGDLPLAEELGRRAGIAVENAAVHTARATIATTLQRSLLPPRLPVIPGLALAARFRAAGGETTRVGGDFYDLFPAGDAWFVVIGDVTGKGPEAAAITSLARYTMRTAALYEPSPVPVLRRLNAALATDPERRQLCTAVCAVIEPGEGLARITLACAGHPPPLHLHDGRAEPVGRTGPLLGAFEDVDWPAVEIDLGAGESLVLYTDGVTDTRGDDGRFGQRRLEELCSGLCEADAEDAAARIDEALLAFERGPQRDDVALLVLRAGRAGAPAEGTLVAEATVG